MAIKNPYPTTEHRVFKRTFLQQTEVSVKFTPAIRDEDFHDRMLPFLKSVFNLDLSNKADADANHAEVTSDQEQKKFVFDLDQAKFIIGAKSYKTFAETAIPMIGMLIRFINDVAKIDTLDQINIVKINMWPMKTENAFKSFTNMIKYTFKEKCVEDMLSYKFDEDPQPVRLSKTSNNTIAENANLDVVLSAEVVSKENVNLGLALNASAKNISINDVLSDTVVLNDAIYHGFTETISDNIINLMCRENLS
jgi:hypothetical protein